MKRRNLKHVLLALFIGLLTLSWVGSVSGMHPGWVGFHANLKGFPGSTQNDQHVKPADDGLDLRATTVEQGEPGYLPGKGFEGAQQGNYPGHRPNGK